MKCTIESNLRIIPEKQMLLIEFAYILNSIQSANNETELRREFGCARAEYFIWGFGSNHMWVKQLKPNGSPYLERLIFVQY